MTNLTRGAWDDLIIIRAGTFIQGHRLADQHIAKTLAASGVPVLYVNPPITAVGARREPHLRDNYYGPKLFEYAPHLAVVNTPTPPGKTRPVVKNLVDVLQRRAVQAAVRKLTRRPRAMLSVAHDPTLLGSCGERTSVFWARDDYTAGAQLMNLPVARVAASEQSTAAAADLVIAVSPNIARRWQDAGYRTEMIPNGCDASGMLADPAFNDASRTSRAMPDDVTLTGPIAGVVGTIGERIDLSLLAQVARSGVSILLVGQKQRNLPDERLRQLTDLPNVQWVGYKSPEELPRYLAALDVGLVPYTDSQFNRASFPLKTLEYLAAGLRVVSTPLPASEWLATPHVPIAPSGPEYVAAVQSALATTPSPAEVQERQKFAASHDWSQRATQILELLP